MQKQKLDRLVLDTNVIVSAIINNKFEEIAGLKVNFQIDIYTCQQQIDELKNTLSKQKIKKLLTSPPKIYIETFRDFVIEMQIDKRFDRSPDPDDNYLFDLAYSVKSYFIVTGEKALLNMKQVNEIQIVSINHLRKMIKK